MGAARERHAASRHSPPAPAAMMDANAEASNQRARAALCMALLTLQYGVQPLISKRFTGYPPLHTPSYPFCFLLFIGFHSMPITMCTSWAMRVVAAQI